MHTVTHSFLSISLYSKHRIRTHLSVYIRKDIISSQRSITTDRPAQEVGPIQGFTRGPHRNGVNSNFRELLLCLELQSAQIVRTWRTCWLGLQIDDRQYHVVAPLSYTYLEPVSSYISVCVGDSTANLESNLLSACHWPSSSHVTT